MMVKYTPNLVIDPKVPIAVRNMPEDQYRDHPAIGSTDFKDFAKSPSAWAAKKDEAIVEDEEKKELLIGSAIHALSMGFPFNLDLHETFNGKTQKGVLTAKAQDNRLIVENAVRCLSYDQTFQLLCSWEKEVSLFAALPCGLWVKARLDFFLDNRPVEMQAYDLKTSKDSGEYEFNKSVAEYGYHIQKSWYLMLLKAVFGFPQQYQSEVEQATKTETRDFRFFVIGKGNFEMHDYGLSSEYDTLAGKIIADNVEKMAEAIKFNSFRAVPEELKPPKYMEEK